MKLRIILAAIVVLASIGVFANTKVQSFSKEDYAKFVQANPKVKIVTVTPIVATVDQCPTRQFMCSNTYTAELLVTYEQ